MAMELQKDIEASCVRYWIIRPVLVVLVLVALIAGTEVFSEHLKGWFPALIFPVMLVCGVLLKRLNRRC